MMRHGHGCGVSKIGWVLVVIGALNWGLVGLGAFFSSNWNVVNLLLGNWPSVEWIIYILVGLGGVLVLFGCRCKKCRVAKGGDMHMHQGEGGPQG